MDRQDITIALFSHDSVGLGHARRNRALAFALAEHLPRITGKTVRGMLIAGHPDASQDRLPEGWDWMIIPGMTRRGVGYGARHLNVSEQRIVRMRSRTVRAMLAELEPDMLIVDRHPYGINGELREAIAEQRARGGMTILGMREILDTPSVVAKEWEAQGGADAIAEDFDAIWLYGDPSVYDARTTGELPGKLAEIAITTGYLGAGRPEMNSPSEDDPQAASVVRPIVLTVLGGGSDGYAVARRSVLAEVPAGHQHLVVTGPQMPEGLVADLTQLAGERTTVIRSTSDVPALIAEASAVVCMSGYNTSAEILATDTPALMIPRASRREEQPRRAAALADRGAVDWMPLDTVDSMDITRWFAESVTRRVDRRGVDIDGLAHVPEIAARMLSERAAACAVVAPVPVVAPDDATPDDAPDDAPAAATPAAACAIPTPLALLRKDSAHARAI